MRLSAAQLSALFAGSDGGAEHWATIASLVELNDVDPLAYRPTPHRTVTLGRQISSSYGKRSDHSRKKFSKVS
ncbi:hypothetical protein V5279_41000 [Bradyrhizobium sp. 26S5]